MRPLARGTTLGPDQVRALLPQRDPMCLVDRVVGLRTTADPAILAERDLHPEDPIFAAHFPGRPLWPGTLVIEGLAQTGQLLLLLGGFGLQERGGTGVITDIAVRLKNPARPGQILVYRADLLGVFGSGCRLAVEARVERDVVAEGTVAVALLPFDPPGVSR